MNDLTAADDCPVHDDDVQKTFQLMMMCEGQSSLENGESQDVIVPNRLSVAHAFPSCFSRRHIQNLWHTARRASRSQVLSEQQYVLNKKIMMLIM